jgi:hypothetical protein
LKGCAQCRTRRDVLSNGAQAYEQFHEQVLKPALAVPQSHWPDLRLARALSPRRNFFLRPLFWSAVALTAFLVLALVYLRDSAEPRKMSELLAHASDAPEPLHRRIRISANGQTWSRPALLSRASESAGMEHVEALFVRANYSWENPLSARSFAAWRSHLPRKRDRVTYVDAADRVNRLYHVETETPDGTLRVASLTLRSNNLEAIDGAFEFENHERVSMADAGQDLNSAPSNTPQSVPAGANSSRQPTGHAVTAADELRVFAALDQIGADVDEPLSVEPDAAKQHIIIAGMGMPPAREQQIRETLAGIPNAVVRFSSAQAPAPNAHSAAGANRSTADANPTLRYLLEQSAGGAPQLEAITRQALDSSNALLARAHTLLILAQKFPPDVETSLNERDREVLTELRHKHAMVIRQTALNLASALKPLLATPAPNAARYAETGVASHASWQSGAEELFDLVRAQDESLTNLLGANDSSEVAQAVLNRLPQNLQQVEALADRQARVE